MFISGKKRLYFEKSPYGGYSVHSQLAEKLKEKENDVYINHFHQQNLTL